MTTAYIISILGLDLRMLKFHSKVLTGQLRIEHTLKNLLQ